MYRIALHCEVLHRRENATKRTPDGELVICSMYAHQYHKYHKYTETWQRSHSTYELCWELVDDPCVAPFTLKGMYGRKGKRKKEERRIEEKSRLPVKCTKNGSSGSILSGSVPQATGRLDLYVKV